MSMASNRDQVLMDLARAAALSVDEIDPDEELLGLGVDSVRLMRLVERWRESGADLSFADVAACATVDDAVTLVAQSRASSPHPETPSADQR